MKYRTDEQFEEICDSMLNGNWTQAAEECVEYGFYAGDLRKFQENAKLEDSNIIDDDLDFVELIEMATKLRYMKKLTTYDPKKHKTVLVGYIDGTTLKMKKNRKKHFMRVVDGYGIQADALYQLKDLGIDKIIIEESDTGISWQSSPDKWRMLGRLADYGNGKQYFLSTKYMAKHDQKAKEA